MEMKDHQPQEVWGHDVYRKWQAYSLFPDLNQNKINQNNSHAAIIATWHYPAHIQCRMHCASETGVGNAFHLYGPWANDKHDDKQVNFNIFCISNAYSSGAGHIPHLSWKGWHEAMSPQNLWMATNRREHKFEDWGFFFSYCMMDGNGTGSVLSSGFLWCSELCPCRGAHCAQVNQHVTWMVGLKMHPVF